MDELEKYLVKILSPVVRNRKIRHYLVVTYNALKNALKKRLMKYADKKKYNQDKREYCKQNSRKNFEYNSEYEMPCIVEYRGKAGCPDSHFWQDLWGARRIADRMPLKHFDIGSRIDGFISHLMLLNIPTTLIDIRPLDKELPGITFIQDDATELENIEDDSIDSLSALCSLEHFGLGRYGDPIDPEGCFKAFKAIQRVMKKGGYIYLSLPVGKERLCFNAHRIFYPRTIVNEFNKCKLVEFSVIDTNETPVFIEQCDLDKYNLSYSFGMGLFIFKKE